MEEHKNYYKLDSTSKFAYCSRCRTLLKRVYKRDYYRWKAIGWTCEACEKIFFDDKLLEKSGECSDPDAGKKCSDSIGDLSEVDLL